VKPIPSKLLLPASEMSFKYIFMWNWMATWW